MKANTIQNIIAILAISVFSLHPVNAQSDSVRTIDPSRSIVYASDTIPVMHLPEINVYNKSKFSYLINNRKYRRTIANVKKAHPYAVIANDRLSMLDSTLMTIDSEQERKIYSEETEAKILEEFKKEVRRLTVKQGIILVKLIDRETGRTSYQALRDVRGGITAFFWQGIARLYGYNLKMEFEPKGEDKVIEDIVTAMEWGLI